MKKSILILTVAVVCTLFSSSMTYAQENGNRDAQGKVVRGPYETNKFGDNWFIGAGVGAGIYIGGYNQNFSARIRPTYDVNFGKWFTPSVGARIDFNIAPMYREMISGSWHKFTYWNLHADFLWNLSNAFGGYKETRVYQVIPYVGAGYAQCSSTSINGVAHGFALNAGIINKFRVSNRIDLNLEISATGCEQKQDQVRQSCHSTIDVPLTAVVGITFKLGKTNFKRVSTDINAAVKASEESLKKEYDKFKNELTAQNDKLKAENEELKAALAAVPAPVPVETKNSNVTFLTLYFTIGKSTLSAQELANLETYMQSISALAKGEKKNIEIVGAADKATGNHDINYRLSKERAEYVKNILVNKYNISESKIKITVAGDSDNRFETPSLNRTATVFLTIE